MAKGKTSTDPNKPKRVRKSSQKYFVARITGSSEPVIVVAKTQKAALDSILSLKAGTPDDLISAGREGWRVIDTDAVKYGQSDLTETQS
jgi:hypothetical protein